MNSLKETVAEIITTNWAAIPESERPVEGTADWHINQVLAALQTAVLAAAPEKEDENNNTVRSYQYKRIGYNQALNDYTKALQQLFESEG